MKMAGYKALAVACGVASLLGLQGCSQFSETVRDPGAGMNGGFEVTESDLPVNWIMYTPKTVPDSDFDIVLDTDDFVQGKQSLKFVVRACMSTGGWHSPGFCQEFRDTKPGETYKVTFWAKNSGSAFAFTAHSAKAMSGEHGNVIRSSESFDTWRQFTCTNTILPQMWLRLELNVLQPGVFRIDDVRITKMDDGD